MAEDFLKRMAGLFESEQTNIFLALAGTSILKHIVSSWISKCFQSREYKLFGEVEKLVIYPMKSGKGIEMETALCSPLGLSYEGIYDRHWVLATKNGTLIDQLMVPRLALIQVSIHGDVISFDAPDMDTLQLSINPTVDQACVKKINTPGRPMAALDCGDEAAVWFQEYTKRQGVRFYCSTSDMEKRTSSEVTRKWAHGGRTCDKLAFSYIGPFNMINTASLDYLNSQLESAVSFRNFRPNILIKGIKAFEEDNLNEMKIDDATFQLLDKTARCRQININQDTGRSDKGHEPFKTLKKFRTFPKYGPGKPCIGVYLGLNQSARIKVGDPVYYR